MRGDVRGRAQEGTERGNHLLRVSPRSRALHGQTAGRGTEWQEDQAGRRLGEGIFEIEIQIQKQRQEEIQKPLGIALAFSLGVQGSLSLRVAQEGGGPFPLCIALCQPR